MKIQLTGRRAQTLACGLALLLATTAATPSLAGTVYGSAVEGGFTHLFTIGHAGPGRITDADGPISITAGGPFTPFPLNAMAGQGDHLVATASNTTIQYYGHLLPDLTEGGVQVDTSYIEVFPGGPTLSVPITSMAPFGAGVLGNNWNGAFNTLYRMVDSGPASPAAGTVTDYGVLFTVPGSFDVFGLQVDSMARHNADFYATTHVGGSDLIFRIVSNGGADPNYHVEDLGILTFGVGGPGYAIPLTAMVETDTGLQGVAWDPLGFNDYFDITLDPTGPGAAVVGQSILRDIDDHIVRDKVTTLGFIADQDTGGGNDPPIAGIPEPATWALMLGGFGLAGAALRRRAPQRA